MTVQELKDRKILLFECISGSKAYGLDTPASDTDIKGVFCLPRDQFYSLEYTAQVNNDTNDEVYYELGRFIDLLARNNPNMLELLVTPADCILYRHPLMDAFDPAMFLSRMCKDTFAGYAHTQIRKAKGYKKKAVNPVAKQRKSLLDFCIVLEGPASYPLVQWLQQHEYEQSCCGLSAIAHTKGMFALFYDASGGLAYRGIVSGPESNEVSVSPVPEGQQQIAYMYCNVESYSAYCREYREYWDWVAGRNEARYLGNRAHGKDYDAKNMMHTIRLLQMAEELLREGILNIKRPNREELLAIKRGEYDYDTLLRMSDDLIDRINMAIEQSPLPEQPDQERITAALVLVRKELYR